MVNDETIANLIFAVGKQYKDQIDEKRSIDNKIRMEVFRKLTLIQQSIKGLMSYEQLGFEKE